jgi:NAD(P)-dependent dehydrogenase (short-subunit alcohol dehydrogenase family)
MIAIVTGATSGIGHAISEALLARGATVVGVGRQQTALEDLSRNPRFVSVVHDVTDVEGLVSKMRDIERRFGRVDVLVNNAGTAEARTIGDTDTTFFRQTIDTNLTAPAATIHALWPALCASGGCIINVSSLAQLDPFPGFFAYAASKAGLHLLTVVAATEGKDAGVRAFTLAPGVVDTPLHRRMMPESIPPINGLVSVLQPADVARATCEIIDGVHDADNGWVLAMPAPAAVADVAHWVATHPGGGVRILQ